MQKLNFPEYEFNIKEGQDYHRIFDPARRKYVALTPEEWVRQHMIQYLVTEKKVPLSLLVVEAGLKLFKTRKRTDLVVYGRLGKPLMIVECKAPDVKISEEVFDQIVRYNFSLRVPYLTVTNGLVHICCYLPPLLNHYKVLNQIPDFDDMHPR